MMMAVRSYLNPLAINPRRVVRPMLSRALSRRFYRMLNQIFRLSGLQSRDLQQYMGRVKCCCLARFFGAFRGIYTPILRAPRIGSPQPSAIIILNL